MGTLLANVFVETLVGNLFLGTLLGNLFLKTLLWNLFLKTLLGNLFLGTLLGNLFRTLLVSLFLGNLCSVTLGGPCLGTCCWELRGPRLSHHIVCCPEWQGSTLHEEIIDGEDSSVRIDVSEVEATEQGTLAPSWKKLEGEIKLLWHRLQIPLDLRSAMDDGPMTSVTPERTEQPIPVSGQVGCKLPTVILQCPQAHLDDMQKYESSTRKLIRNWLRREKLLESVCNSHALGVNDQRLAKLKADVQRLDRLSCSLVNDIGTWSRKFAELIVDPSRDPMAPPNSSKPRPIFVWAGRDAIERIQSDAERLIRGDLSVCHRDDSKTPQGQMNRAGGSHEKRKHSGIAEA
eukprot:s1049_g10.t1